MDMLNFRDIQDGREGGWYLERNVGTFILKRIKLWEWTFIVLWFYGGSKEEKFRKVMKDQDEFFCKE